MPGGGAYSVLNLEVPVYKAVVRIPQLYIGVDTAWPWLWGRFWGFLILERLKDVHAVFWKLAYRTQTSQHTGRVLCVPMHPGSNIARYLMNGRRVYMCLFNLQKAFDSIEYPVLLNCLYQAEINGRLWRIMRS